MDTRTAVWVSTAEKLFKIVLGETQNFSQKLRGVSAPALHIIKKPAVTKSGCLRPARPLTSPLADEARA